MTIDRAINSLNEERMRTWERGKELLDRAAAQGRDMTAEENMNFQSAMDRITAIDRERNSLLGSDEAQRTMETINAEAQRAAWSDAGRYDHDRDEARDMIKDFFRPVRAPGSVNSFYVNLERAKNVVEGVRQGAAGPELRLLAGDTGSSGGSLTIPTLVASEIYAYMTAEVAMRRIGCTIMTTDTGAPMNLPRVNAHGIATQIANTNTAFSGTDANFAMMTLNAYDFGQLVQVSNDLLEDSAVDMLNFVAQNVGRAIGQYSATQYVTGSGSNAPNGISTVAPTGNAGTIATGGSLILGPAGREFEKLTDVVYGVNTSYRDSGACAWLMKDSTASTVRKLRSGSGGTQDNFLWQPSPTVGMSGGQPDLLLGYPLFTDPNVSAMGSDNKIAFFGDWRAYYLRDVKGLRFERSDDLAFDKNQASFRGLLRSDSDCIDTTALVTLHQNVT